jgi:hypothetical protein
MDFLSTLPDSRDYRKIAKWSILILLLITISGCGGGQATPKLEQLTVGMTVKQVEEVLGKPIEIFMGSENKRYKGDGDHTIIVIYKNGTAEEFKEKKIDRGPRFPFIG